MTIWVLLGCLLLSGCELFQSIPDKPTTVDRRDPEDDFEDLDPLNAFGENRPTEPMDTIRWQELSESSYPPITESGLPPVEDPNRVANVPIEVVGIGENGSQLLSGYKVGLLLPFLTNRFDTLNNVIPPNSQWALHFYSGMQLALEEIEQEGRIRLQVDVLDSQAEQQAVSQLLRDNDPLRNAHLVIGPYMRENVRLVAEQVKETGQVLVSPYSAADQISTNNPNYIQVSPTLETHCQAIIRHALQNYRPDQIILVSSNNQQEIDRFRFFQDEFRRIQGGAYTDPLQELVLESGTVDLSRIVFGERPVFILPVWADQQFISLFLESVERIYNRLDQVFVYGMPQWLYFDQLNLTIREQLNVHITSSLYIDKLNPDIQEFRVRFFNRFSTLPRDEAYLGYDVGYYFIEQMNRHGTRFQFQLERERERMLGTEFHFQRVLVPTDRDPQPLGTENRMIDHWENKYLNVLQFRRNKFEKIN